jgi:hypothetical protein
MMPEAKPTSKPGASPSGSSRIDVHVYLHGEFAGSADQKLDQILALLRTAVVQERTLMASVADVKAQADKALAAIADESTKDDSIIALVQANTALITSLKQQLADAIAAGSDPAALQAILDQLTAAETSALANSAKVVAAVNAGTA